MMSITAPLYLLKHIEVRLQLSTSKSESVLMRIAAEDSVHEFVNDEIPCRLEARLKDVLDCVSCLGLDRHHVLKASSVTA